MTGNDDTTGPSINNPHDAAFKSAFRKKELAVSFFRNYLPEKIAGLIDFDHLVIDSGSYVDEKLRDRHSDIVYRTRIKSNGLEAILYLLFEHQSAPDPRMVFRLLCYMINIWKAYEDQHPNEKKLPIILPVVLYHGKRRWDAPMRMTEMINGPEDFSMFMPDFTYQLHDLGLYEDDALVSPAGRPELRVVLYQFKHITDKDLSILMRKLMDLVRETRESPMFLEILEWALRYAYHARNDAEEDFKRIIDRETDRIGDPNVRRAAMTLAEKIEQRGMEKGRTALILKLLRKRFGNIPPGIEHRLEHSGTDLLDRFGESIFDFKDPQDAQRWWEEHGKGGHA